jgi:hypothetical protein
MFLGQDWMTGCMKKGFWVGGKWRTLFGFGDLFGHYEAASAGAGRSAPHVKLAKLKRSLPTPLLGV